MTNKSLDELEILQKKAKRKVLAKKAWYFHLITFIGTSLILYTISISTNWGSFVEFWILFPILPLLIALAIHYVAVFGFPISNILTKSWEEEEYEKELEKLIDSRPDLLEFSNKSEEERLILDDQLKITLPRSDNDFV